MKSIITTLLIILLLASCNSNVLRDDKQHFALIDGKPYFITHNIAANYFIEPIDTSTYLYHQLIKQQSQSK